MHPATVELARGANYGSITTALPGGDFQTRSIWGGTEVHRQKFKNLERDPRVTLTIRNEQDPYQSGMTT